MGRIAESAACAAFWNPHRLKGMTNDDSAKLAALVAKLRAIPTAPPRDPAAGRLAVREVRGS